MKRAVKAILLFVAALLMTSPSGISVARKAREDLNILRVETYASHASIHPGELFRIAVVGYIKEGLHVNSHSPTDEFLVPTVVKFTETKGITLSPASYPIPQLKSFSFSKGKMSVYEGKISIFAQGQLSKDIAPCDVVVSGMLTYQACNDRRCFMPESVDFAIPLKIVERSKPTKLINKTIFEKHASLTPDELHAKEVIEKGLIYAVAAFFLFGLALNLTPCVYPIIPMTVSFFGFQGKQEKGKIFVLAFYYVVGIAIIFSILGLISGLAGRQWGFLFQSPWFVIFISIVVLSMAAGMFGAFEITVPSSLMSFGGKSRHGALGSLIMGLTVGVVIAPCATGIVIGLVGVIAKLGMVGKGTLLFFVMGLGLGLPYLLLATSSGLLARLPRSGVWMVWIRKFFGMLLIAVAIYFLVPQGKQVYDQQGFYLGVLGIFSGLLLGFLEHSKGYSRTLRIIRASFGFVLILAGVLLVNHALHSHQKTIDWVSYKNQSIEQLKKANKPILIDFYADWCAACDELDRRTFSDKRVMQKGDEFLMVRVDFTSLDQARTALMKKFKVSGLPTIIFLNAKGKELNSLRATGFLEPAEMLRRMHYATTRDP